MKKRISGKTTEIYFDVPIEIENEFKEQCDAILETLETNLQDRFLFPSILELDIERRNLEFFDNLKKFKEQREREKISKRSSK